MNRVGTPQFTIAELLAVLAALLVLSTAAICAYIDLSTDSNDCGGLFPPH